jgi:hypothetical protein
MPYHQNFVNKVKEQPMSLGVRLGRWAIYLDVPVAKIAMATGATRQSIYTWMKGGPIFTAYQPAVERVLQCMQTSQTGEEAWKKICLEFDLKT